MERTARNLHECEACGSALVQPREWHEAEPLDGPSQSRSYWVERWCPECEWVDTELFEASLLEGYEDELDRGTDLLIAALRDLEYENMAAEMDRFAGALRAGAVLPADFEL